MSAVMEEEIKRWAAQRNSALVLEIPQYKTTVSEGEPAVSCAAGRDRGMGGGGQAGHGNTLRAKPADVREQYERQLKELQEAYGEAILELRARKQLQSLLEKDEP